MLKAYSEYKDSGIDFPREIPTHWKSMKLGKIGRFSASGIDKKSDPDEVPVRMVNYTDVYGNSSLAIPSSEGLMETTTNFEKAREHSLRKGDVLFTPSSETEKDIGVSAVVTNDLLGTVYSYHLIRFRSASNSRLSLGFRKYFCNSHEVLSQFSRLCKGTTRQILGRDDFCTIGIILPPEDEQLKIANFLDYKIAQIDALITKKDRMIDLLREERTAVINQAVTKGLDPNVELKDSGVDWLGKVPKHWRVAPLKWHLQIASGDSISIEVLTEECNGAHTVPVIGGNGLMGHTIKSNVFEPVLAIGRVGALCGNVHFIIPPAWITDNALKISNLKGYCPEFLCLMLTSMNLNKLANQNAQPLITGTLVKNQYAPVPSLKEQLEIVTYFNHKTSLIDVQISREQKLIDFLKEYRVTLISEAVTGKIDVRG